LLRSEYAGLDQPVELAPAADHENDGEREQRDRDDVHRAYLRR
jgi:hypothetical protein